MVVVIVVIKPISLPHSAWYLPHCLEQASQSYLLIKPVDFLLEMWHVRKINWWKLKFLPVFIETQNKNKLYLTFFLICHLFASGPGLEQNRKCGDEQF